MIQAFLETEAFGLDLCPYEFSTSFQLKDWRVDLGCHIYSKGLPGKEDTKTSAHETAVSQSFFTSTAGTGNKKKNEG